jgi:hypothetical protein
LRNTELDIRNLGVILRTTRYNIINRHVTHLDTERIPYVSRIKQRTQQVPGGLSGEDAAGFCGIESKAVCMI